MALFFKLDAGDGYFDSRAFGDVEMVEDLTIPCVRCPVCGPWGVSYRLRATLPADGSEFCGLRWLSPADWTAQRPGWARKLDVDPESILPGMVIGPPVGVCRRPPRLDAVFPSLDSHWVRASVVDAIRSAGLQGVEFERVQMSGRCEGIELYDLIALGRYETGNPLDLPRCESCGRLTAGADRSVLYESRWDGSDFFLVNRHPPLIYVSSRAKELLDGKFSNLVFKPVTTR